MALLEVDNLSISIRVNDKLVPVLHSCSFNVNEKETLGIVGESGCGKSITALAIMGLLESSQVVITGGSVNFDGKNLLTLKPKLRRSVMGDEMAMIFQEPMTSLNPVYRIGDQITEALHQHRKLTQAAARLRALELLEQVHLPEPEVSINQYPHQLSGGQRQRVMIAIALACDPKLLIADEPTTALDVTVQKEVLELMQELQQRTGTAIVLISHDLGVIAETCDQVLVMYRGQIVEAAPTNVLFAAVGHPYTRGLINSRPSIEHDIEWLQAIPGRVPDIEQAITGCAFHPRCSFASQVCRDVQPGVTKLENDHRVQCHHTLDIASRAVVP